MSKGKTLKRVSLVAVSALSFGLLSATAPANATAADGSTIASVVIGTIPSARVGETVTIPVTVNTTTATDANETVVIAAKVSSAPSTNLGNTATSRLSSDSTGAQQTANNVRLWLSTSASGVFPTVVLTGKTLSAANTYSTRMQTSDGAYVGTASSTTAGDLNVGCGSGLCVPATALAVANSTADSAIVGYLSFIPDVAGTYSFLVSATSYGGTGSPTHPAFISGDVSAVASVTTGGAPTAVTLTNIGGATSHSGTGIGGKGALIRVNLTGGALTGDEAINVTVSGGFIAEASLSGAGAFTSATPTASTRAALTRGDFSNGMAFVNVLPTSASQSIIVTAEGTGSLAAISATTTVTSLAAAASLDFATWAGAAGTAVTTGWTAVSGSAAAMRTTATSASIELTHAELTATGGASSGAIYYGAVSFVDTSGTLTGAPTGPTHSLEFDKGVTATGSATTGELYTVVTQSLSAGAGGFTFNPSGTTLGSQTVTREASTTSSTLGSVTPQFNGTTASSIRAATGASVTVSARVLDQFGLAFANNAVTVTVAGRNAARVSETLTTNSSGVITTTITDSGTASVSDTVTFTASNSSGAAGATGTATITWGEFTVGTVTVTGGYTATDTYKGQNTRAISTAVAGPHGDSVAITATVKDSSGNVLAGVPVTFTVSKGLIQKTATIDYTTVYTGSTGTAVTRVIDWTEGEQVITATAGGKSGTDYLTWEAKTASSARSISGVASGNRVTATVKDRYGNTVRGVVVNAKTSAGYFGSGTSSTTGTTDADGVVSFFLNGANGAATVTLSLDKDTYPQSIDKAGEVGATAVTAVTAGTTIGTGASLSAAGINSVDVAVTVTDAAATAAEAASDAALEAIDAANAATDAANLAAEAADAATVAAEEARDAADAATAAVEALASEVATLIAGLKAQITTLANTVAKIAKRVRA